MIVKQKAHKHFSIQKRCIETSPRHRRRIECGTGHYSVGRFSTAVRGRLPPAMPTSGISERQWTLVVCMCADVRL